MHIRGLSEERNYNYVKQGIGWYGLDVILHVPAPPFTDERDLISNLEWENNPLWYWKTKILFKIDIEHGPSWVEFIASNFRTPPEYYAIVKNLCYGTTTYVTNMVGIMRTIRLQGGI